MIYLSTFISASRQAGKTHCIHILIFAALISIFRPVNSLTFLSCLSHLITYEWNPLFYSMSLFVNLPVVAEEFLDTQFSWDGSRSWTTKKEKKWNPTKILEGYWCRIHLFFPFFFLLFLSLKNDGKNSKDKDIRLNYWQNMRAAVRKSSMINATKMKVLAWEICTVTSVLSLNVLLKQWD